MTEPPELVAGSDFLAFAGVTPHELRVYPRTTHIAEKLHAYTLPRQRENTRVKDLPDIALLSTVGELSGADLGRAIEATFAFRGTHDVSREMPPPPTSWTSVYARMAKVDRLPWPGLDELTAAVQRFLNPLLTGQAAGAIWVPAQERWV